MTSTLEPLTTGEFPCYLCEAPVHQIPTRFDEWGWAGRDGKQTGVDSDLRNLDVSPYERLAYLASRSDEYFKIKKRDMTPEREAAHQREIREYIALKTRMDVASGWHTHYVIHHELPDDERAKRNNIRHCDYPAWRRPSGWQCRKCGAAMGDDQTVGYL